MLEAQWGGRVRTARGRINKSPREGDLDDDFTIMVGMDGAGNRFIISMRSSTVWVGTRVDELLLLKYMKVCCIYPACMCQKIKRTWDRVFLFPSHIHSWNTASGGILSSPLCHQSPHLFFMLVRWGHLPGNILFVRLISLSFNLQTAW